MRALAILFLVALAACQSPKSPATAETKAPGTAIQGLGSPIILDGEQTEVVLRDYIADPSHIEAITGPEGIALDWAAGDDILTLRGSVKSGIASIRLKVGDHEYAIPLKNAAKVSYGYRYEGSPEAEMVQLTGDFNGWNPEKTVLTKTDGGWEITLDLYPGNYAYQVVVDGSWGLDPAIEETRSNGMGGFNSIMKVAPSEASKVPHLKLTNAADGKVELLSSATDNYVLCLLNNEVVFEAAALQAISIQIPKAAAGVERSYLRIWSGNAQGLSNEVRIPLQEGIPVENPSLLTRNDKERTVLYFMMVDRFNNGDATNDEPVNDERVAPRANYRGGDLAGIKSKLDDGYFDELGINTLWISPITQNPLGAFQEYPEPHRFYSGYHGYWPVLFTKVDHRLGNSKTLHGLVDGAHDKGYNIILDFVANHVHEEHPFIQAHPEYKTQLDLPDGTKNIRIWDAQRLTTWFDTFLPSFDFSKPEVVNVVSDSALFWIKEYDFDGFRHDATKHIPETFWRATTSKLKGLSAETGKNYFQVGETFGDRELIQSYIGSGMMDGQFDFNVYFDARAVFQDTTVSMDVLAASLKSTLNIHGALHQMCNITGNHDLPRFISYAGLGIGPEENEKEVGWEREVKVENVIGYQRLKMLETFVATIPGIPVIYYGDEIGMPGANDPDNRRMMRFDSLSAREGDVKRHVKTILNLRKEHLAFIYGDFEIEHVSKNAMAYSRSYLDDHVVVCFNNSAQLLTLTLPWSGPAGDALFDAAHSFDPEREEVTVTVAPFTSQIIFSKPKH